MSVDRDNEQLQQSRTLEEMRREIDEIDSSILDAFRKRMALSAEIAKYKQEHDIPVLDIDREKQKLDRIAKNVEDELSAFSSKLYLTLADLSKLYQEKVLDGEGRQPDTED